MAAWDRQPKEPPRAYQHFTVYRDLGPVRTLDNTAKLQGVSLATLLEQSARWNWVARADQWDAHVQQISQRAYLDEAAKSARRRAQAFTALLGKSLEALRSVDISKATLAHVAAAMKAATEGLRLEEGLETARVSMEVVDARTIISRLPAEVRAGLLAALDEQSRAGGDSDDPERVPLGIGCRED